MPHVLVPYEVSDHTDLGEVQQFACGDDVWSLAAADWIKGSGVRSSMRRGTRVWLYKTGAGVLVAYGSLGKTRWRVVPEADLSIIPSIAI